VDESPAQAAGGDQEPARDPGFNRAVRVHRVRMPAPGAFGPVSSLWLEKVPAIAGTAAAAAAPGRLKTDVLDP